MGITAEVIGQKEEEILNILKSQNTVISGQAGDSNIGDHNQLPVVGDLSSVDIFLYLSTGIY